MASRLSLCVLGWMLMSCPVFAGTVENSTQYPAPAGDYKELTAIENTYLATNSGKVGVGTTIPSSSLQVIGGIRAKRGGPDPAALPPYGTGLPNSNYTDAGYSFENDGDTGMFRSMGTGGNPTWGGADLLFTNEGVEIMRITNGGTIGIRNPSPETSKTNPTNGAARTIRVDVAESMLVDDVYMRAPTFGQPRWASQKQWRIGQHCGFYTYNAADGADVNIPCEGYSIYRGGERTNSGNFSCPSGFEKAGGDYQSDGNRYLWTCVRTVE